MSNISEHGYFGPYRLLSVANIGQTSRLWQAYDDRNREFVGLKTLLKQFVKDKTQDAMLQWEHTVAAGFSHPHVVNVKGFGRDNASGPYLVLEWFFTPNLKYWINRGYATYADYLPEIMLMMTDGLRYMHDQGWVHRDIKPDNYLYLPPGKPDEVERTAEPNVKLIDFALAKKEVSGISKWFTRKSKAQGTASYMAPEQILGKPPAPDVDIYSLGCSFYELLTGRLPFSGGTINDLLAKHLAAPIPSITARNKNVTEDMAELLRLMLAKKADERPKNAKDLYVALKGIRILKRKPSPNDV